jgi:hypothetical protein
MAGENELVYPLAALLGLQKFPQFRHGKSQRAGLLAEIVPCKFRICFLRRAFLRILYRIQESSAKIK